MIGVTASDSPEFVVPHTACTLRVGISSCVAWTALVGSPCVSRVMISILRPFTPPAALIASAANKTPRLKPMAGAELGPVSAASQPILIGSACANTRRGMPSEQTPAAAHAPSVNLRRVTMSILQDVGSSLRGGSPGSLFQAGDGVQVEGEAEARALGHQRVAVVEL